MTVDKYFCHATASVFLIFIIGSWRIKIQYDYRLGNNKTILSKERGNGTISYCTTITSRNVLYDYRSCLRPSLLLIMEP